MKTKLFGILFALVLVSLVPVFTQAQTDLGIRDTVIILTSRPEAGANDSLFIVEIWIWHDVVENTPTVGFKWTSDKLTLDSAKASAEATSLFNQMFFYDGSKALSNTNNRAMFSGLNFSGTGIPPKADRYLLSTYYFTISPKWEAADEIVVDTAGWDDGSELFFLDASTFSTWKPVYFMGDADIRVLDPSDVAGQNGLPDVYSLSQNYPNPFNPVTNIDFSLEKAGEYTLTIYNVIGQVVHEVSDLGKPGYNQYPWNASNQASGVYFYKLTADGFTETKKMMLLK